MYNSTNKNVLSSTGIAILASLGIHGLLWAVLPGLTLSQADKPPSQRTIGLVDLSPQEQNRLPQVSNPVENTLPAFASQLTALPPAPPSPPYQTSVAPPLQLSPGSTPLYNTIPSQNSAPPPVQTFQVPLPPPPTTSFQPNPYQNVPSSSNYYQNPPAPQAPPFVLPSNNGLPNVPLTPDRTLPADNVATAIPSPGQGQPTASPSTPAPEANRLPERGKQELLAMRESMRNNFPRRNATSPVTNRSMSRQEIATALRATRNNQPALANRSMSRQEIATDLRQQTRSNQPALANRSMSRQEIATALRRPTRNRSNELSPETKTAIDTLNNFKRQQAAVQAQNPGVVTSSPIRRKLTACDRKLDDLAIVSVVVNPEGKRLSEPVLISRPRKANLTKAQNYVKNYQFAKTGKTTNYNFRLEFDYSARKCAQAQPTPITPKPTPTPDTPKLIPPSTTPSTSKPTPTLTPNTLDAPTPNNTSEPSPSPEVTATPQSIDPQKPSF